MIYENDIKKDTENKKTDSFLSDRNSLNYKSFLDFASKKTEKLVMALYMITDGQDVDEALSKKIRLLAVDLMSQIHVLSGLYKTQKNLSIISTQCKIEEIISFVGIGETIGFISEMNAQILKREFDILSQELVRFEEENKSKATYLNENSKNTTERFILDKDFFSVSLPKYKDLTQLPEFKRTDYDKGHIKDSFNKNVPYKKEGLLNYKKDNQDKITREERRNKIIDFLKDKNFVSIRDISMSIIDCSEKTIQRELNELLSLNKVIKEGDKRWSKYKLNI